MTITLNALQKQRRDTASNWTSNNTVLLAGELGYESDTKKFKIGDGTTAWQSLDYIPIPDTNRLLTGNLTVGGNFTVNGTTTTIDTTTLTVEDKNIEIGKVSSPSDTTADGGGISLLGTTTKTINWVDSTDSWTLSEHLDLANGKVFKINNTEILSATGLGSTVVSSSLTSVGTIATGVWNATAISGSKVTPDFGSQNITTTGTVHSTLLSSSQTGTGGLLKLARTGTASGEYQFRMSNDSGNDCNLRIYDVKASATRLTISSSGQLLLGTTATRSPGTITAKLQVEGTDVSTSSVSLTRNSADAFGSNLIFNKSRGASVGSDTVVQNNDDLGTIAFVGNDGTDSDTYAARIVCAVDGTPSGNNMPARLEFLTNGGAASPTERMRIDSSGKVGIGTTAPTDLVDLYSSSHNQRLLRLSQATSPTGAAGFIGFNSDGTTDSNVVTLGVQYASDYYNVLNIKRSTRFVGIGTTNPSTLLHLVGSTSSALSTGGTFGIRQKGDTNSDGITISSSHANSGRIYKDSDGALHIYNTGGDSNDFVISNIGNVGIGTNSPVSALNIFDGSDNDAILFVQGADTTSEYVSLGVQTGRAIVRGGGSGSTSTALAFEYSNAGTETEAMRIDSSGRLLLGQTSDTDGALCMNGVLAFSAGGNGTASTSNARPNISRGADGQLLLAGGKDSGSSIRFDVAASASTNAAEVARFDNGGNLLIGTTTLSLGTSSFGFVVFSGGAFNNFSNVNGSSSVLRAGGNQGEAKVMGDGDLQNTNNSYGQISDETLKQDIVDAASQWNDIKNLKVRKFRFKDNPTGVLQIGVIAQEIETVSAGLVQEDDKGLKSVKYSVLYMKAVKCLQEAIAKIEVLETKVAALEAA